MRTLLRPRDKLFVKALMDPIYQPKHDSSNKHPGQSLLWGERQFHPEGRNAGGGGGGGEERKGEGKAVRGAGWGEGGLKRRLAQILHRLGKRGENPWVRAIRLAACHAANPPLSAEKILIVPPPPPRSPPPLPCPLYTPYLPVLSTSTLAPAVGTTDAEIKVPSV